MTHPLITHPPLDARAEIVDRFQQGRLDVLILTYGVGSTGITLTRSHTVVLMDRPWTPGDTAQAEVDVNYVIPPPLPVVM